jgi:mRNA-degrading endonuclease YafQ of YafQ-DinJ toxin-antitoxin module
MNIYTSSSFDSAYKRLVRKKPEARTLLLTALSLLRNDFHSPSLKVHKLKGDMEGRWAFSLTYDLRVIFRIVKTDIWLINIGDHDEVY